MRTTNSTNLINMKKILTVLAFSGVAAASAQTGSGLSDLSVSGTFAYESEYVFRGIELDDRAWQPAVELGYPIAGGSAYAGIWGSFGSTGGDEVDYYLGYAFPVTDVFTLDTGITFYSYPESVINDLTQEVYIGAAADVLLSPALYFYYDFEVEAVTVEASIGYSVDLAEYASLDGTSIDFGAYLGQTWGEGDADWAYWGVTADLVYGISDNVSTAIGLRYASNNEDGAADEHIWYGVSVGFAY
jgi:uncharacterized protein (TIGR02001 family)